MGDSSLNEFNRLLHGRELSDEELAYEFNQKKEADELLQDYSAMFGDKSEGGYDDKERIDKLEVEIALLTAKMNEQQNLLTSLMESPTVSSETTSVVVDSKGCCGWFFARSS
jgi:hypothetical protein